MKIRTRLLHFIASKIPSDILYAELRDTVHTNIFNDKNPSATFMVKTVKCPEWHDVIMATREGESLHVSFDNETVLERIAPKKGSSD